MEKVLKPKNKPKYLYYFLCFLKRAYKCLKTLNQQVYFVLCDKGGVQRALENQVSKGCVFGTFSS